MKRNTILRDCIESFLCSVILVLFFRTFLAEAVQVPSRSMEDTLLPGDHLFINKFTFRYHSRKPPLPLLPFADVRRRDIVVFKFFVGPDRSEYYVKRVVGLPGETIEIRRKQVYINGAPLDEPYAMFKDPAHRDVRPRDDHEPITIPPDHFFVLGDNRDLSLDSRYWGPLARADIIGKPLFVWWSFDGNDATSVTDSRVGHRLFSFFRQTRWYRTGQSIR